MYIVPLLIWLLAYENPVHANSQDLIVREQDSRSPSSEDALRGRIPDKDCVNGPLTRACWKNGFSLADDFDKKWPWTGVTRYYNWDIVNTTLAPDGFKRIVLVVNGQYPGPAIRADWGDMVSVTVNNKLQDNGTTIHWHGMRMYHTNPVDGVPGITQCPIAPGDSRTYLFHATQYGTSWYHSHVDVQYCEGVVGPIIIDGPATANYDEDLGALPLTDWFHTPVSALVYIAHRTLGQPPAADNALINGSMVAPPGQSGGKYSRTWMQKGKKYRLRLVNTGNNDQYIVSLDNHDFNVISNDFVPIIPYWTHWLFIAIGQRYDVIIHANQSVGNYWFRVEAQTKVLCGNNKNNARIRAIFSYHGADNKDPTSRGTNYTQSCADPPSSSLIPYWNSYVPKGPLVEGRLNTAVQLGVTLQGENVVEWGINLSALAVDWSKPTLQYVLDNNFNISKSNNVIFVDEAKWYYWIIQEVPGVPVTINVPHPMHLHGHDFYILGSGQGNFSAVDRSKLQSKNPPRRDTAMLPAGGWLVLAFQTDNPGAWLMHCHIAWHSEMGFAVQFLEGWNETKAIAALPEYRGVFDQNCAKWKEYYPKHAAYLRDVGDSGI